MTLAQMAVSVVMAFVSLGYINPNDSEAVAQNVTSIIGSIGALVVGVAGLWKYTHERAAIKRESMRTEMQSKVAMMSSPEVRMNITTPEQAS